MNMQPEGHSYDYISATREQLSAYFRELDQKLEQLQSPQATPEQTSSSICSCCGKSVKDLFEELMDHAREYLPQSELAAIEAAFLFAAGEHDKGEPRKSGERYIVHPLHVAIGCVKLQLPASVIIAALAHDLAEDIDHIGIEDIRGQFGDKVALLVDGLTKFPKGDTLSDIRRQTANSEKLQVAITNNLLIAVIKLYDRWHNLRTLGAMSPEKQRAIAQESLDVYATLAEGLGLRQVMRDLRDLSLKYLDPKGYDKAVALRNSNSHRRQMYMSAFVSTLQNELKRKGIEAEVVSRLRHIFSVYEKIDECRKQDRPFDDISDTFRLIIVVESREDCYTALGVVRDLWKPLTEYIKGSVDRPRANLYESFHEKVLGIDRHPIDVLILSSEMYQRAEYGIAVTWLNRNENGDADMDPTERQTWQSQILAWAEEIHDAYR